MTFRPTFLIALGCLVLGAACQPKIGDSCSNSIDCSSQGDRVCDITQPGGYCTVVGCEADHCPDEAACVAFRTSVSTNPACAKSTNPSRLETRFCMRRCGSDEDCRGPFRCVDVSESNPWAASSAEEGGQHSKVCLVDLESSDEWEEPSSSVGVCEYPQPELTVPEPLPALAEPVPIAVRQTSSGGAAGSGGSAGSRDAAGSAGVGADAGGAGPSGGAAPLAAGASGAADALAGASGND